jgi:hypothetical protein
MIMTERFFFRGHAVGAAATVTRMRGQDMPAEALPTQAASSLPVVGGRSEQVLQGSTARHLDPFLSFQTARTFAEGRFDPSQKAHITQITATLTGVELVGKFSAERLHAQLVSVHPGGGKQPCISWTGTALAGLRLEGYAVEVVLDPVLESMPSEEQLVAAYAKPPFHNTHGERFFRREPDGKAPGAIPRIGRSGYIGCSIVESIRTDHPRAKVDGHKLTLKEFGTLYFGELLISAESRRLTLIRFELGCPDEGSGVLCDVVSNGETLP